MNGPLIEIAPDPVGWGVRVQGATKVSFPACEAAVRYARTTAESLGLGGGEPRIRVYFTLSARAAAAG